MECKHMVNKSFRLTFTLAIVMVSLQATASSLTVPNTFTSGTATSASDMNANFTAVKAAIDDNNTRISSLAGATSSFQGFSTDLSNGGAGLIAMGNICNASFTGSHVCSTLEFASSSYSSATGLTGNAWIQARSLAGTGTTVVDQVSHLAGNYTAMTCGGWTTASASDEALTVSSVGGFSQIACSSSLAVACCK
jgi:hypothetical protein